MVSATVWVEPAYGFGLNWLKRSTVCRRVSFSSRAHLLDLQHRAGAAVVPEIAEVRERPVGVIGREVVTAERPGERPQLLVEIVVELENVSG